MPNKKFQINTCVIVENEMKSANDLKKLLEQHYPAFDLLDICRTVEDAKDKLPSFNADLIFMDVLMDNGKTCFEILDNIPDDDHRIIFITHSDKHAEQAFEYNAVEYIRKPYTLAELKKAITKAKGMRFLHPDDLNEAKVAMLETNPMKRKVNLEKNGLIVRLPLEQIYYFKGAGQGAKFSYVYLKEDDADDFPHLLSKPLNQLDTYHDLPLIFLRTRSCWINTEHIESIDKKMLKVTLDNGQVVKLSRIEFEKLEHLLKIR